MAGNEPQSSNDDQPQRLQQIIRAFRAAIERGESPDRDELLSRYPDLRADLKRLFADLDEKTVALDATIPPDKTSQMEDATQVISNSGNQFFMEPDRSRIGEKVRYFGDYELLEEIARGGMGVVYKAKQTKLNRIVALKMILSGQLAGDEEVKRFHAEAEAAANLDHPGIVPIYEVGEHAGQHFFSMGFVEGESLANRIKNGLLAPKESAKCVRKIAEAIAYAHGRGVIHRDLKPANVLLDRYGQPKVTDFGLAKRVEGDSDLTATGQILGTPSYMPPEQAAGKPDAIDERADIYSLGAILYTLLTGRPPFQSANNMDVLLQVLQKEPVRAQSLNPAVPSDLDTICTKCLQKSPSRRYQTASELNAESTRYIAGQPILARPVSRLERVYRWCMRNPSLASALGLAVLLASILAIGGPVIAVSERGLRSRADDERERADRNARTAQSEKNVALRERDKAERTLYRLQITSAQREFESGNVGAARELLDGCVTDLRGWEHDYLSTLVKEGRQLELQHSSYLVTEIAFSPTAPLLCCVGGQGVSMWNYQSQEQLWSLDDNDLALGTESLACTAFSPDGSTVLIGYSEGFFGGAGHGALQILDSKNGRSVKSLSGGHDGVTCAAYSPSGDYIVSGSGQKTLKMWEAESGELLWEQEGHLGPITDVTFSANGNAIASSSEDGTARLWATRDGTLRNTLNGHQGGISCVCISPDGRSVATGGGDHTGEGDFTIKLWDASTGLPQGTLQGHSTYITDLAYSADGKILVSSSGDQTIKQWDHATGRSLTTFRDRDGTVDTISLSNDGTILASGSEGDSSVILWDTGSSPGPLSLIGNVAGESLDLTKIILESNDHEFVMWDTVSGRRVEIAQDRSIVPMDLTLQRDGSYLVFGTENSIAEILNLTTGKQLIELPELDGPLASAEFNSEGSSVLTVALNGTNQLWDATTGELLLAVNPSAANGLRRYSHKNWIGLLRHSSKESRMIGLVDDERITLWDSLSGQQLRAFSIRGELRSVDWTPDMSLIVAASGDGQKLEVFDTESGKVRFIKSDLADPVSYVVSSPVGNRFASVSLTNRGKRSVLRLWDIESGEKILQHEVIVGTLNFTGAVFSHDGSKLIACGDRDSISMWDTQTGEPIRSFRGHTDDIGSMAFSPDGSRIASCASNNAVKIWDASSGDEVLTLSMREPGGVRFSNDGKRLLCFAFSSPQRLLLFDGSTPNNSRN